MKFWAVLGSRGCREKKLPTAISMQLFGVFFNFCGQKNLKNTPKSCILMDIGSCCFFTAPTAQNSQEFHFRFINSFIQPSLVRSLSVSKVWSSGVYNCFIKTGLMSLQVHSIAILTYQVHMCYQSEECRAALSQSSPVLLYKRTFHTVKMLSFSILRLRQVIKG